MSINLDERVISLFKFDRLKKTRERARKTAIKRLNCHGLLVIGEEKETEQLLDRLTAYMSS